jgi:site-specific recombinase XerD
MASVPSQESKMTSATNEGGALQRILEDEIEPFLQRLRAARYTNETLQRKRTITKEFAQWAQQRLIVADNIDRNTAAESCWSLNHA